MKNSSPTRKLAGRSAASLLALTACAGIVTTASAATPAVDAPTATVRYGDLNLSTDVGAKMLYSRISMAARQVCPSTDSRELAQLSAARACQRAAIERAVHSVNNPRLAAALAAATHRG